MPSTDQRSSVPKRQLGRYLKLAREEAGMALEPSARTLEFSRAKMYRIERGEVALRTMEVTAMCQLYGVTAEMTDVLVSLTKATKAEGWWHAYGEAVPSWFELFVGMEENAAHIREYSSFLVPGLLQTPDYAATYFRSRPGISEQEVAAKVAFRLERQRILTRRSPRAPELAAIVEESVLRRPIADKDAWLAQLAYLANVNRLPSVSVRVLPSAVGVMWAANAVPFSIFEFPSIGTRPPEQPTIYSENMTGAIYLDKPAEVAAYDEIWRRLDALALGQEDSEDLLAVIIREAVDD
ncbi:helix-turn-helix transcriptional regulator [Micromonosporaceae bacterium B7E4]